MLFISCGIECSNVCSDTVARFGFRFDFFCKRKTNATIIYWPRLIGIESQCDIKPAATKTRTFNLCENMNCMWRARLCGAIVCTKHDKFGITSIYVAKISSDTLHVFQGGLKWFKMAINSLGFGWKNRHPFNCVRNDNRALVLLLLLLLCLVEAFNSIPMQIVLQTRHQRRKEDH